MKKQSKLAKTCQSNLSQSARSAADSIKKLQNLPNYPHLVLLCGRYEGIDERLLQSSVDEEISIGDFVVSGGELPAMMLMDAVLRLVPGVLGDIQSAEQDSFFRRPF